MKETVQPIIVFPNEQVVCPLGQGTWKMGQSAAKRTEEIQALQHGIELGMNLVDTAGMYDNEELVGEAIRDYRDKVFLVSKVLPGNASYQGIKLACERSLHRLGTECIDLYLLHWKGRHPSGETVRAMTELQQEGKIRMWGVSNLDITDIVITHVSRSYRRVDRSERDARVSGRRNSSFPGRLPGYSLQEKKLLAVSVRTSPEGAYYSARSLSAGGVLRQIQFVKWSLMNPDACRWA